jgi:hypothetical protein
VAIAAGIILALVAVVLLVPTQVGSSCLATSSVLTLSDAIMAGNYVI